MKYTFLLSILLVGLQAFGEAPVHGYTKEQSQQMALHNTQSAASDFVAELFRPFKKQARSLDIQRLPFAEYHEVGYVIFNDGDDYNSLAAKKLIAKNLPEGVTLVVYTGSLNKDYQKKLFNLFSQEISPDRLKVIYLPMGARGFWARDGIPVPTWTLEETGAKKFSVVDAVYYHGFEPDREVSELFSAELIKHNYYHEGGNFLANSRGECLIVDNERAARIPDLTFKEKYGCQKTIRFPHTKGIGHIDETVKLINDNLAITDDGEYAQILQANGFQVQMVPRPQNEYETYVNSLYVNGTLFLPTFSREGDKDAIKLYESFGYKVVSLDSWSLSNNGLGSIHCITMAYPPVSFKELLTNLGGSEVSPPQ
jgi:hypothetical protein